eukprot:TRINITY_DN26912_c0_g1_i1.p1 TRINITY_DN26912_c0_g1~~TRINITY_DN26912_c0_g1_i1.p1  ORF type:complete len:1089 (-),score=227.97 TRINITY_DN26912_c0_g1_i1:230-3496(-)
MMMADPMEEQLPNFWVCCAMATVLGGGIAMFDDSGAHRGTVGTGPVSHLDECADSSYALFADGLFEEGGGFGLLDPLRRVFSARPEGIYGLGGIIAVIGSLLSAIGGLLQATANWLLGSHGTSSLEKEAKDAKTVPESTTHEKVKMRFSEELCNYRGYTYLYLLGIIREYTIRILASVWGGKLCRGYVNRERWHTGWADFYKNHCYTAMEDCLHRPISSAPDAEIDVVQRTRAGGTLFGPLHEFEFTKKTKRCVNLSSYNYLGFGGIDTYCTPEARKAALEIGFSSSGTRGEGGTMPIHRELEAEVASYLSKEDAVVLGMGFASNSTILPALFEAQAGGSGILVLSDALNHRSIVEGVRLSGASVRAFEHNSMTSLEAELKKAHEEGQSGGKPWRKIFIVVEGIYSMEGDFCRLREIVTLKNRYKAYLFLDEAHSIGAVGPTGRGVTELLGVPTSEVEVMMGTFTKSFGSAGGYVAASKEVIDALRQSAPGMLYASSMSPPCAAQALVALRVISGSKGGTVGAEKLKAIKDNSNYFRKRMEEEGFKVLGDYDSPIIPMMIHHPRKIAWFSRMCMERGIAVVVVGYPVVPLLYERARFCISAAHTQEQLAGVIKDLVDIGGQLGLRFELGRDPAELAARKARDETYAKWLHDAPLELRKDAKIAPCAANWTPASLMPAPPPGGFPALSLESVTKVEKRGPRNLRLFDPLCYAAKPSEATKRAIETTMDTYGFGACGPRGFYGGTMPHYELEWAIASFLKTDNAILYSLDGVTMSSVIPALVQSGDRVIVDTSVHLGIRAGLRLTKSLITWVPQGDVAAVEAALQSGKDGKKKKGKEQKGRTFIIAEGLSQRTGRIAPLKELVELKEKYDALLILDEALSFGTLGKHGRGLTEACDIATSRVDAIVGSLEHSIASVGGFCAGRSRLIEHQRLGGAGYCFSAASPPSSCASATATIKDMQGSDGVARLAKLRSAAATLHGALQDALEANGASASVKLTSGSESYVQHLMWTGAAKDGEDKLIAVAKHCGAAGFGVQVCKAGLCPAEFSFDERIGKPAEQPPSLRLCANAELSAEDAKAAAKAVQNALRAAK